MNTPAKKSQDIKIKSFPIATTYSALKQQKMGSTVNEICETYGCSKQSFSVWRKSEKQPK
jgi:hypothetical protein